MTANEVLYTDGQDVVVTPSTFQVKGTAYTLLGITQHGMAVIRAVRWPGVIMLFLGVGLALLGTAGLISPSLVSDVELNGKFITANKMAVWVGGGLGILGLLLVVLVRQRYAVRIATAEGEKNVVVSNRQEYINQIINALNRAFMVVDVKKSHMNRTVYL
jgi:hypothetical protein